jgi:hypothetical protein
MPIKTMQGVKNFKVTDAQRAKIIKNFKNAKEKLLKTNAAIWFNEIRRINQLTRKYIQVNPLKTKCILSNIKTQCVPRSKHSPPQF